MKLKCNLCVKRYGDAKNTEKLYLRTIKGRDYLVCEFCKDSEVTNKTWRYYEPSYPLFK